MNTKIKVIALVVVVAVIALVLLRGRAQAPAPVAKQPLATIAFSCDAGKGMVGVFYEGEKKPAPAPGEPPTPTGSVTLKLSDGRNLELKQTISADGARYTNADESFIFWGKGNRAFVLEGGKEKDYTGCIVLAPEQAGANLPLTYSNSAAGFSIRFPLGFTPDESYTYPLAPGKNIPGIKFTIPATMASGTNLSADSYLSFESLPKSAKETACTADLFLLKAKALDASEGDLKYSVATTNGAAAGNRYSEAVFAIPGSNPCVAIRYYVHSTVFENYPAGKVQKFDEQALLAEFDTIRHTLILAPAQ